MPASPARSSVGPEPRSNAEPKALGELAVSEVLGGRVFAAPAPFTSADRYLLSLPAWTGFPLSPETGVVLGLCGLLGGVGFVGFEPPPVARHSL